MEIQPFGDRVVIKVVQPETKSEGGLIMATSKQASNRGIVEAVGENVTGNIKAGDTVIFNLGSGVSYSTSSADYKILSVKDILGKIIKGE